MSPRLKRLALARTCALCGTELKLAWQRKYDPFWLVLLIFVGAVLAFYLVGIVMMGVGLLLLQKEIRMWLCPTCSRRGQRGAA